MGRLVEYRGTDKARVGAFLEDPDGRHLYLLSRIERPDEGRGLVWLEGEEVAGFAWFGTGRNLVLAGDTEGFVPALAKAAREAARTWVMVVGPLAPVSAFLALYCGATGRQPRLDRQQAFLVQTPGTLPDLHEPALRSARDEDLTGLVEAAARMSAEDFEIDPWRIDREAVRRTTREKIREERAFLFEAGDELVFKVDLALRHPSGGQVEGVFTAESHRGQGIAARCMAELGHRLLGGLPRLTLHVSSVNVPALRAYAKAGYETVDELRLAIFPPAW